MSIRIIEEITCEKCGEVVRFEKADFTVQMVRLETTAEWLKCVGWTVVVDGFHIFTTCPRCVAGTRLYRIRVNIDPTLSDIVSEARRKERELKEAETETKENT